MQESQFVGYDKLLFHEPPIHFIAWSVSTGIIYVPVHNVCISPNNAEHYTAPYDSLPLDNKLVKMWKEVISA
jgi:hypothetical protein